MSPLKSLSLSDASTTCPALPARADMPTIAIERGRKNRATAFPPRAAASPVMPSHCTPTLALPRTRGRECAVRLKHHEVGAVAERVPVGLHLHADLELLARAIDHVGDEVDADIKRDADHGIRLGAAERRRAAVGDSVRVHHARAGDLAPFDIAPASGEDAHRARKVLILAGRLAVLEHELLAFGSFPVRLGEVEMPDGALDGQRVVKGHVRLAHSGTSISAALEPQLRP